MAKSNDYICFSLSAEALKIVHVKGQGNNAKVVQIISRSVSGLSDVEIIPVIEASIKGLPSKTANISLITPHSITTTKNIEVPSTNDSEIESIVSLQASRHTPFSREEIQVGYVGVGVHKGNSTRVLLVIANRVQLKDQIKIFEKAGLKINKVVFASEAVAKLYARSSPVLGAAGPVAIIDFDKKTTTFNVVKTGKILMSRVIPLGKDDLSGGSAEAQTKVIDELKKTVDSYLSEGIDNPLASYFFTSEESFVKDLAPELKKRYEWDVQVAGYGELVKATPAILDQIAAAKDQSFLEVMASGVLNQEAKINLIPDEVQLQKSIEEQRIRIFETAILCIVGLVLLACVFYLKLYFKGAFLEKMISKYSDTTKQVEALKKEDDKTVLLKEFLDSRMESLDTIYQLYKNLSDDVYLTRVILEENGKVSVQGVSESTQAEIFELKKTFESSDFFKEAEVTSHKTKQEQGTKVYPFEMSMNLKTAKVEVEEDAKEGTKEDTKKDAAKTDGSKKDSSKNDKSKDDKSKDAKKSESKKTEKKKS